MGLNFERNRLARKSQSHDPSIAWNKATRARVEGNSV